MGGGGLVRKTSSFVTRYLVKFPVRLEMFFLFTRGSNLKSCVVVT